MDLTPMHKRVIAIEARITACAVVEHDDGRLVTKRDFGAFKRDRRALAQWPLEIRPKASSKNNLNTIDVQLIMSGWT